MDLYESIILVAVLGTGCRVAKAGKLKKVLK